MLRSLLRKHPLRATPTLLRFLHHTIPKPPDQSTAATTVSYLKNSCGLSSSAALSAAAKIHLKSTANADAVLALVKAHGFTKLEIANLVSKHPAFLVARAEKTIKPKLEFFAGIGYTGADLGKLISSDPKLLSCSLEKRIVRNFNLLKTLLGSPEAMVAAIAGSSRLLRDNLSSMLLPNLQILRDHGVPAPKIVMLLTRYPRVLMKKPDRFTETVKLLKEMGLKSTSTNFVLAINTMMGLTTATWERKLAIYRSLGWSDKETLMAFTKQPYCMLSSDKKIRKVMGFLVKKLNWDPAFVAARPKLLCHSFEKRTIPRCSVLSILKSNGVVSRKLSVYSFLLLSEKDFLEKYVIKYREQIPEVLEAYEGKLEFVGFKEEYRRS